MSKRQSGDPLAKYDSDVPEGHPTAETRNMCSRDAYLRANGFRIVRRPADSEPVWVRGDKECVQSMALRIIATELEKE
jgi:hypothetical protein